MLKKKLLLPLLLLVKLKLKALTPILILLVGLKALKALILSKVSILLVVGFLIVQLCMKLGKKFTHYFKEYLYRIFFLQECRCQYRCQLLWWQNFLPCTDQLKPQHRTEHHRLLQTIHTDLGIPAVVAATAEATEDRMLVGTLTTWPTVRISPIR